MKIVCKACGKAHKSNAKLEASLKSLQPGSSLRMKCLQCGESILLGRELLGQGAGSASQAAPPPFVAKRVKPPEPPDTSWLEDGIFEEDEIVSDIPQSMVLMPEGPGREQVIKALTGLGYRAETALDTEHALERMQFFNYSSIVMHAHWTSSQLADNEFHRFLCSMNMARRRYIFYVLIGPEFKTFYNLQALAESANLVVNEKDTPYFGVILRKSIPDYEELFGPYMEELKVQRK
ncbi:MAG: hypothetical protein IH612_18125 [Desulfofustis sp.]|nr:hypothetical protein [Desulfofustis sp.]